MIEKIIIIGSGPAAYSAAIYTQEMNPLMLRGGFIGSIGPGGQLTTTTHVDNYPGYPKGVQGPDLMTTMYEQVEKLGIRQIDRTVINIQKEEGIFLVKTKKITYKTECIIISTGASAKRLYVEGTGDNELWQKGISACAVCDGYFYKDKITCVIGGGDSAMEEVLFLSKICKKVYLIHRREEFRCRPDKLQEVKNTDNIKILTPYNLKSAHGTDKLEYILLDNNKKIELDGLFFGIGHTPNTQFIEENFSNILSDDKYIKVDEKCQTEEEGIYACGDVFDKKYRQAVTAAASGCVAGKNALKYIKQKNN
ncbi:thioredoxin reductase [Vairimorpha necatrix]|uniref:Thioredoxin reductase n=1 Tax=Vairimorpha necatrix TaxID=6039 RepID=A0AAX4JGQ5_9MICR